MAVKCWSDITGPVPAYAIDRAYHLRHGTARQAIEGGGLVGMLRKGSGGKTQGWVFEADARAWFFNGMPRVKPLEVL